MKPIALLLLALSLAPAAFADTTLVYHDGAGQPSYTVFIKGQQLRMETHADDSVVLYDGAARALTVLDANSHEYLVLDQETLATIQQQMKQALAMAAQFGMDPKALGLDELKREQEVEVKTGETKTVNGYDCELRRYEVGGAVDSFVCLAEPAEVGIEGGDWRVMQGMFEAMMKMATDALPAGFADFNMAAPDGVAVESYDADGSDKEVLAQVDDATLDAALFEVPAGYTRTNLGPGFGG